MRKYNGKSNLSGAIIEEYRKKNKMSREDLARSLQLLGLNIDRTTILRAEKQSTILKDFELIAIMKISSIDYEDLEKEFDKAQQKS